MAADTKPTVHDEGRDGFFAERGCPYPPNDQRFDAWWEGYHEAEADTAAGDASSVECHEGTGLGELLSPEEGRRRLAQYGQIQTTAIEAFRARVEEAIIAEINDPKNAVESPQWRQGLRIARVILNREAKAVNNGN